MRIDLGPRGPAGIEAKYNGDVLYIVGSDHWRDWAHHILPGARHREASAAIELHKYLGRHKLHPRIVAGHSLGGAVAMILAYLLRENYRTVSCYLFGPKRTPAKYHTVAKVYRHAGDIVPFLPITRRKYQQVTVIGERMPFWKAHGPDTYYSVMESVGVR